MDQMVNYIQLAWNLACILRTYRTCNPTVGFSKYEFNNKLPLGILKNPNGKTENEIYIYIHYICLEVKYFSIFRYLL